MKLTMLLVAASALAQAPEPARSVAPAQGAAPEGTTPAARAVEPWRGTIAEGLAEVRARSEANDPDGARALADRLLAPNAWLKWKQDLASVPGWKASLARASEPVLDFLGLEAHAPAVRAEIAFARGVVEHVAGEDAAARAAFERARADAGPGELRLASGYQLGTSRLLEGERWRAEIPEIQAANAAASGAPQAAPVPVPPVPPVAAGPGGASAPGQPAPPDPLKEARTAYLAARERFVDRLRADWTDAAVRANTELVQRRLKELDAIEEKRKEEEEKKEQEKQDSKDPNKDPNQQKQDSKDDKSDSKDEQDPANQPKPDDPKPDEKPPEEQEPEEAPAEDEKPPQADPTRAEERELSKEEMTRLLDLLKQREQQWKKLQKELQHARRGKVKKDW